MNERVNMSEHSHRRRRKAMPSHQRRKRRVGIGVSLTTADQLELENSVRDTMCNKIIDSIPLVAWMLWIFLGTAFYRFHDQYDWAMALYISVSVGWAMGWDPPFIAEFHNNAMSKLYSSLHVTIGEIFVGVTVIYLAQELVYETENWMISMVKARDIQNQTILSRVKTTLFRFRILLVLLVWITFGIIFHSTIHAEWSLLDACDYVISTLTGSGYKAIPDDSPKWLFVVSALFTFSGYPLTVIALGLIVSSILAGSHERSIYQKICEDVSNDEVEVMRSCGIGKNDDFLSKEDFIVLMLVRIGAAPAQLVQKIHDRFRTLDRKKEGRIAYDDIVYGRKKNPTKKDIITKLFMRSFSATSLIVHGGLRKVSMAPLSFKSPSSVCPEKSCCTRTARNDSFADMQTLPDDHVEDEISGSLTGRLKGYVSVSPKALEEGCSFSAHDTHEEKESHDRSVPLLVMEEVERPRAISAPPTLLTQPLTLVRRESTPLEPFPQDPDVSNCDTDSEVGAAIASGGVDRIPLSQAVTDTSKDYDTEYEHNDRVMPLLTSRSIETPSTRNRSPRISKVVAYQLDEQKKQELLSTIRNGRDKQLLQTVKEYIKLFIRDSHFVLFCIWFTWLYGGALFFSLAGTTTFSRGLYISVSVGYGIFWAEPDYTPLLKAYSILHLLFGSCMVACAMAAFARSIVESHKKWYVDAIRRQAIKDAMQTEEVWDDIVAFTNYWFPKLKVPILFVTWAALGIIWSCVYVKWSFYDGLYFVTSGLATGGMWPIPEDSPEWFFFFVGVYISCGVPIMALAVGTLADIVANSRSEMQLEEKMHARVTNEELQIMTDCGIENGDGYIDMAEFVILILVRLRAVSPELIGVIEDRFVVLDADKNGTLTYNELTVRTVEVVRRIQSNTSLRRILTNFE